MNHVELVKRAAKLTWRYKVLWVLGFLIALTAGGGNGSSSRFSNSFGSGGDSFGGFENGIPLPDNFGAILLLICVILFLLIVVMTIVSTVARTGLYRSVDKIEETGVAPTWRAALRLGWNHRSVRIFLADLVVGLVFLLAAMLLFLLGATPLLLRFIDNEVLSTIGIVLTVILEMLAFLIFMVAAAVISVLGKFWHREIALHDRSVGEAISNSVQLARKNAANVGVFWLLMAGIGIGIGIAFIPIILVLLAAAGAVGVGLGYAAHAATNSELISVLVGLPPALIIFLLPTAFVNGIFEVFNSSAWTLAYRELTGAATSAALPDPQLEPAPALPEQIQS